jgi:hypothetical protein
MSQEEDWRLPDAYSVEHHVCSRITLWRSDTSVWDFSRGTPRRTIELWAEAHAHGHQAGMNEGRTAGRNHLASELRVLLGV